MSEENYKAGLPESLLSKLFDHTGPEEGGGKGFLLFYIDENGNVSTTQKTQNQTVALALMKTLEIYTKGIE